MNDLSGLAAREHGHAERWVRKHARLGDTIRVLGRSNNRMIVTFADSDGNIIAGERTHLRLRDYEVLEVSRVDADMPAQDVMPASPATHDQIAATCDGIKAMLLAKNRRYGNSALEPVRIFSRATPVEQILVRLDDKLSRLRSAQLDEDEDVIDDLIGYLVLLKIARTK
jgi:hypothetical protein